MSRQDPKLRSRLLLLTLRKGRGGFLPADKGSGCCRVSLMPPLCFKDGLTDVSLVPLLVFFPPRNAAPPPPPPPCYVDCSILLFLCLIS